MPSPILTSDFPWLWERAHREPAKPALLCDGRSLSFAELAVRAETAAARLTALGIGAGDRMVSQSTIRHTQRGKKGSFPGVTFSPDAKPAFPGAAGKAVDQTG